LSVVSDRLRKARKKKGYTQVEVQVDWLYGKTDDPKKKNNQASREIDENRKYLIDKIMRASDEVLPDLTIIVNRVIPDKD
jgi:hypothetical protein